MYSIVASLALFTILSPPSLAHATGPSARPSAPADTVEVARYATLGQAVADEIAQVAKLTASGDDADIGDQFGYAVSLSGDRALVGARRDDEGGLNAGAAYVFAFDASQTPGQQWVLEAKLIATDADPVSNFGVGVSLDGERAIVEASGERAYVFAYDASMPVGQQWPQQAVLDAGGALVSSASIDGGRALLGAASAAGGGAVYVYTFDAAQPPGQQWSQQAVLTADDADPFDGFGASVSLDGDRALIGASGDDGAAEGAGAAYVFDFDGSAWNQQAKLTADDASVGVVFGEGFGRSVSLDGDRALVGAPFKQYDGNSGWSGAAYVFAFDGAAWSQEAKLDPLGPAGGSDEAGASVSLDGDRALIGTDPAQPSNGGTAFGSAYLFAFDGAAWNQEARISADDEAENDQFGESVSLSGSRALIGSSLDDDGALDAGSAYLFDLSADLPLVADAGPDQTVVAGRTVGLDGTGSTGDNSLDFAWTLPNATLVGADGATPSFCPTDPGTYTATLVVSLGDESSAPDAVTVTALSPVGAIDALVADVLATPELSRGQARILISELRKAQRAIEREVDPFTLPFTFLTNFQGSVLGFKVNGTLTAAQSDALVDPADKIISALLSPCTESAARASSAAHSAFGLGAYPNPSSGRVTVAFSVEAATTVRLSVVDALGREVAVLADGPVEAGAHRAELDATAWPAGVYVLRLATADGRTATERITRLR